MNQPELTVAFTGHRPNKIKDGKNEQSENVLHIKHELKRLIAEKIDNGCCCFLTGMAMGADIWAAEAVLELKELHPEIKLIAVIPLPKLAEEFPPEWKTRYHAVLSQCDETVTVCEQKQSDCFARRNKWLVDHSAHLIGIFNGSRGGSMQTLNMALMNGSDVQIISC